MASGDQSRKDHTLVSLFKPQNRCISLRYLIEGQQMTLCFKGWLTDNIEKMKSTIKREDKHGILQNVDAKDLILHKVSTGFWPAGKNGLTNIPSLIRSMSTSMTAQDMHL